MKKVISLLIVATIMCWSLGAMAADKTAFINMREILFKSDAGQAAAVTLKKFVDQRKQEIQDKEALLKKLKDEIEKQRLTLTEIALKEKELAYQKEFKDYKRYIDDSNEEMQMKEQEIFQSMLPEILKIVSAIGEKENYTMIIDIASMSLPFYSKKSEITDQVITEFNKEFASKKK